jgi:uncharacterized membrane protein YwzB
MSSAPVHWMFFVLKMWPLQATSCESFLPQKIKTST